MQAAVNITLTLGHDFAWQNATYWQDATRRAAIMARFWGFVNRTTATECWTWLGTVNGHKYGVFVLAGRTRAMAHRFAWLVSRGPIPAGKVVCHSCDNPRCVNPNHLRVDSQAGNIHESVRKARKNCWGHQKLDAGRVLAIRDRYAAGGVTQRTLGREFGVARNTVSQIITGKTWGHLSVAHPDAVAS